MNPILEYISWIPFNIISYVKSVNHNDLILDFNQIGVDKKFKFYVLGEDKGLSTQLKTFGFREPLNIEYFYKFIKKEDKLLDVGANIGLFSVLGCKAEKIVCVEPLVEVKNLLKMNLEENNLSKKSEIVSMAVGDKDLLLEVNPKLNLSRIVKKPNKNTYKVKSKPLSYFTRKYKTNLLKLDVEGYEYEILYNKIPKKINKISIEFHTDLLGRVKSKKLINYLWEEGFRFKYLIEDLPIRLYPLHLVLKKTGLINKFTYVYVYPDKEKVLDLVFKGRAQKYFYLER